MIGGEHGFMQRTEWVYQEQESADPWAIRAVCTYVRGTGENFTTAYTIYSEKLARCDFRVEVESEAFQGAMHDFFRITEAFEKFAPLSEADKRQIKEWIVDITTIDFKKG